MLSPLLEVEGREGNVGEKSVWVVGVFHSEGTRVTTGGAEVVVMVLVLKATSSGEH